MPNIQLSNKQNSPERAFQLKALSGLFLLLGGEVYGDKNRPSFFRCGDGDRQGDRSAGLLESLGYHVHRIGNYHTTKEMDSLRIRNRRTWFRYSDKTGGDAITFLQRFCGKSFQEAVECLLAYHGRSRDAPARPSPQAPAKGRTLSVHASPRKRGSPKGICLSSKERDCAAGDPCLSACWPAV